MPDVHHAAVGLDSHHRVQCGWCVVVWSAPCDDVSCAACDAGGGRGAYVAARQSWLQWYPPDVASCGRDFYGIVETFPLRQALPLLLKGSGDCSAVDWTFLGGSIANWSFVMFVVAVVYSLWQYGRALARRSSRP